MGSHGIALVSKYFILFCLLTDTNYNWKGVLGVWRVRAMFWLVGGFVFEWDVIIPEVEIQIPIEG